MTSDSPAMHDLLIYTDVIGSAGLIGRQQSSLD